MKLAYEFPGILFGIMVTITIFVIINTYLIDNGHIKTTDTYDSNDVNGTLVESVYFTTTTLSTIGYGDISPKTQFGKLAIALEHLFIICVAFGGITYKMSS